MLNDETDFDKLIKTIKIKRIDDKFYTEFEYIKDVDDTIQKLIHKRSFLSNIFSKRYEIYKTNLNNRKKIEIAKVIKDSDTYKVMQHLNKIKKVDFFNVAYILQEKNFLTYGIEEGYIEKELLENIKEYLIDIDFNKDYEDYHILIKTQNLYKNKIDNILGI